MNKKLGRNSGKNAKNNQTSAKARGFIRIIGGKWRGRKLPVHDVLGLRPTTDRVKETLFNWLMNKIQHRRCLDCFAGSGSLGFEALSRGAEQLIMIEKDRQAARQLNDNIQLLKAEHGKAINTDCLTWLENLEPGSRFDLVFIDPPFRQQLATKVGQLLHDKQLLTDDALIYLEVESELEDLTLPAQWQLLKQKTAGQVSFSLYQNQPTV